MMVNFTDRTGELRAGKIVREYRAFEGEMRYIIVDEITNREYRCVKKNGTFIEYVA